jgi:hypothetical protein
MHMQPHVEPNVPAANCPHCVKKWPMAIRFVSSPPQGSKSCVEFICKNCGTTLVRELVSQ